MRTMSSFVLLFVAAVVNQDYLLGGGTNNNEGGLRVDERIDPSDFNVGIW